ncbi:hypothetical protein QB910_000070 [Dabrowskivirus KKP3916]|uniref:Uncharacterized protein n=1 Tax=Alicyclobacillus phage KKP_3916 TaxID=3040651 RepID=A0AAT9V7L3_9CAUD|nr:hypothetical protein QB910_000070 [Alicyclobacillus phage KKP 3916]
MRDYIFKLDREAILNHPRTLFLEDDILPINDYLDNIEHYLNVCYAFEGNTVVQHGRVIIARTTDETRLSSAFKSSIYLGKYNDMANTKRFLDNMVTAHHSYEPIRGENVLFLYIGVGKPVYDHLVTYSVGRPSRIAGGQRANVPWGFEVPVEAKNKDLYYASLDTVKAVAVLAKKERQEQMQAARSMLPVGYIMPPFMMEFTEEALIKNVFKQRLFEKGAQGATQEVVADMLKALHMIDPEKWERLEDYHGTHIQRWEKAMRTMRNKRPTVEDFYQSIKGMAMGDFLQADLYELVLEQYGKLPPSMWDKQKQQ